MIQAVSKLVQLPDTPNYANELVFLKKDGKVEIYLSDKDKTLYHKLLTQKENEASGGGGGMQLVYEPHLEAPKSLERIDFGCMQTEALFTITNYDVFKEYIVQSLLGTITVNEADKSLLHYIPPSDPGQEIITINGKEFKIDISQYNGPRGVDLIKPGMHYGSYDNYNLRDPVVYYTDLINLESYVDYSHDGYWYSGRDYYLKAIIYDISTDKDFNNIVYNTRITSNLSNSVSTVLNIDLKPLFPTGIVTLYVRVRVEEGDHYDPLYSKISGYKYYNKFNYSAFPE